ncbi:16S rRNA (guanine(527)-N(7))-methyltransferase RsmG [Falsihalocynthiibacter sp. SS001]|uniref:16S rRNA (guanine(527)-N(7))-methyltransferase RsmG n=1 Tax=Falsihalocynthiibacter sp. SS001 TaxID=3349698 RepID=UPI0036D27011
MSKDHVASALDVSRETMSRLETYVELVGKWNPKINLVSRNSLSDIWSRHILDSAQVFEYGNLTGDWLDIGSGGGFPGIVVAILGQEHAPEMKVTLIESDARKSAFLRTVSRETNINATIITERVENVPPLGVNTLSARALAPLDALLGYAKYHLSDDGVAILAKGATHAREIAEARAKWNFELEEFQSRTDNEAVILRVGAITNA